VQEEKGGAYGANEHTHAGTIWAGKEALASSSTPEKKKGKGKKSVTITTSGRQRKKSGNGGGSKGSPTGGVRRETMKPEPSREGALLEET